MIIRTMKSEVRYLYYEMKSVGKANIIFISLFIILYMYCSFEGKSLDQYTNIECFTIIKVISIYILLRMVITGMALPNNVYEVEINRHNCLHNVGILDVDITSILCVRIFVKAFFSSLLNVLTLFLIMFALNLVVDVKNFLIISSLMLIGIFHILSIGFMLNAVVRVLKLKKEIILVFEVIFLGLYLFIDKDSYFFPITIIMTQISGVISNDILFSQFYLKEIMEYWIFWISIILISCGIIYISNCFTTIILSKDSYRRINEK